MADIQSSLFDAIVPKKHCRRCGNDRPLDDFETDGRSKDKLKPHCRPCRVAQAPGDSQRCPKCELVKPLADFQQDANRPNGKRKTCRKCNWLTTKKRRDANPEGQREAQNKYWRSEKGRAKLRQKNLAKKYGISAQEFDHLLLRQGGVCAVCKNPDAECRWGVLVVDHCHTTKKIRGLLCDHCNRGIGAFKDNPKFLRDAAAYVENAT